MNNLTSFKNMSETEMIGWAHRNARMMITEDGSNIEDTGILLTRMTKATVDRLLGDRVILEREAGRYTVYNFTLDGKVYTLITEITWNASRDCKLTWDHRAGEPEPIAEVEIPVFQPKPEVWLQAGSVSESTPEPEVKTNKQLHDTLKNLISSWNADSNSQSEPDPAIETEAVTPEGETELFKFYYRDLSDRMTLEIQPWEAINNYRMMDGKWQVQKQIGSRWVIIAESKNWHVESVSEKMQRQNNPRPKLSSRLVNGLLVETETKPNETRTRIYFQSTKDPVFSPHIKIYNGTHISVEGNVTIENYGGYLQASEMAVHMLWS